MSAVPEPPEIETLLSASRLGNRQDVAAAESTLWDRVASEGTPLLEPHPQDLGARLATFLWRQTRPADAVELSESVSWRTTVDRRLRHIDGTDTWYLTWPIKADIRSSYHLDVIDGDDVTELPDPTAKVREVLDRWDLDEHGEPVPRSVLVMPDAEPLSWHLDRGAPKGTVTEHLVTSTILGDSRRIWVYLPPGHDDTQDPADLLLVFDGEPHHLATTVLDNLLHEEQIRPTAALLVEQNDRNIELPCNPAWSEFLVRELLPWARSTFRLTDDPARTIITGGSYGGLCSAYNALKHPEVFGNAVLFSPSCWWLPETGEPEAYDRTFATVGARVDVPAIIAEYLAADRVSTRIYHDVGSLEIGPPQGRPFQTYASRHFRDILRLKGYDYLYREYAGGHDDAWWRGRLGEGLIWLVGTRHAGVHPEQLRTGDRPVPNPAEPIGQAR